ncbi:MAG TPA: TolC family protein [Fibrobacteria bacterium]|nr:TolC family protein [Fibrobacteria bacterium]
MNWVLPALLFSLGVQAGGLQISDVVRRTLERQPQLSEDSLSLRQSQAQIERLKRKVVLPEFEVSVGFAPAPGFRYDYQKGTGPDSSRIVDSTRSYAWWPLGPTFGTEISVAQPLNVGRLRAGMKAARAGARVAQAELHGRRQTYVKQSLEYLFGFQYATRMLKMLREANERLDSVQNALQTKLDDGDEDVSQTDLFQIKIGRYELEKSLQEAKLGQDRAREGLAFALGYSSSDSMVIADSLLEPLPDLGSFVDLETRFAHPDLARLKAGLEAKSSLVDVERANMGPDIFVFGKFSYTKAWVANRDEQNKDVLITDPLNAIGGMLGLGFRWHLNFWSQLAEVKRAELDWQQLRRKEVYARRGLLALAKDAWLRYNAMGERQRSAKTALDAADAWLKSVGQQVDLDPSRGKDLIGPYKTWLDYQNKYWDSVHERNKLALEVLLASGTLLEQPALVGTARNQ